MDYCDIIYPVQETENTAVGDPSRWPRGTLLYAKVGTNFADKWLSLGRIVSLWTQATEFSF
jgi:hypothetical protein